jgi:hypothetical protein
METMKTYNIKQLETKFLEEHFYWGYQGIEKLDHDNDLMIGDWNEFMEDYKKVTETQFVEI